MFVRDQFKKAALAASTAESRCSEFDTGIEAIFLSKYGLFDKELLEKIDALKQRLITSFGYDEDSASDVLTYVGSIFARGDADEDED